MHEYFSLLSYYLFNIKLMTVFYLEDNVVRLWMCSKVIDVFETFTCSLQCNIINLRIKKDFQIFHHECIINA